MSVHFEIEGLTELIEELRRLPEALGAEGAVIVEAAADKAFNEIYAGYPTYTGNLKNHLKKQELRSQFGASVTVINNAKHAYWAENGTQVRHYVTKNGRQHVTGRMPAHPLFIPTISRDRRGMYQALGELMQTKGLEVSGDATS